MNTRQPDPPRPGACLTRRSFLLHSGAAVTGTVLLCNIPGFEGISLAAELASYPRKRLGRLSELKDGEPVWFNYPDNSQNSGSMLVKLGVPAGGGIGPDQDVVAFNLLCPHMGGVLHGAYKAADQVIGPCPFHQSCFDLTRHGMIITGHATESLPQVLLESEGDDIHATGLIGLIYGHSDNLRP